ncbi:fumarylacetoacetate hydrolase family protein [Actinomadura sp. NTSP31]|uniref:fumarylacetoacetate hydrolase family protein n=1 Tax=Actinomadura sp. NTSP31 TaxID=1735447 RepID=UPI0035BF2E4F
MEIEVKVAAVRDASGQEYTCQVLGDELFPLTGVSVLDVLAMDVDQRGALAVRARDHRPLRLADVRLLPPVAPPAVRDFMTYQHHFEGATNVVLPGERAAVPSVWYEIPTFYFSNPHAVVGANADVEFPPLCESLDFELELAVVLRSGGKNLSHGEAWNAIGGYTIFNDWSARDLQSHEMQGGIGPAKGKDAASTLGPWITTADEMDRYRIEDRIDITMEVQINGRTAGKTSSRESSWSFADLIVYASRGAHVGAGDVIAAGTCPGGSLLDIWGQSGDQDPPPLKPGDVVTMTAEGIGTISNTLKPASSHYEIPPARRFHR